MVMAITSYTPTTGPVTGGTQCTITGTGLDVVDAVLVGNHDAELVSVAGDGLSVVFITPHGDAAAAVKVAVVDVGGDAIVEAATSFTYTAVTADGEELVSTLAGKYGLRVRNVGDATFTKVRGVLTIKPGRNYTTEDDSDTDSGFDGSDFITTRKNDFTGTVKRGKGVTTGNYDPGQEIMRVAEESVAPVEAQVYDRTGGPEAWQFTAMCQWAPQGGNKTSDKHDFTLLIQGARTVIANPVIADPTLAGPYA